MPFPLYPSLVSSTGKVLCGAGWLFPESTGSVPQHYHVAFSGQKDSQANGQGRQQRYRLKHQKATNRSPLMQTQDQLSPEVGDYLDLYEQAFLLAEEALAEIQQNFSLASDQTVGEKTR